MISDVPRNDRTERSPNTASLQIFLASPMKRELRIWTVGHSTRDLSEFLGLLGANAIEAVADVRSYPGSRRYPQFNADTLAPSLASGGIDYTAFSQLGGRRQPRADSPNTVWRNKAFRGYADYMETAEFREGITDLIELARFKRTAIMCAEAVWWRCHRSMISDFLKVAGVTVEHIMDREGKNVVHPFTSAAHIDNGKLVYGSEREPLPDQRLF